MAHLNIDAVNPSRAYELASHMVKKRDIPFFFHGSPGIGKSEIVEQIAREQGMALEVLMLTQIDSQDLRGIQYPDPESKRMVYYPPEFLPGPTSPSSILFFDVLTGAEPRLQVSAYQLLLSRRIGSYKLPDNCYVCAAGNGPADGAIAYEMGTALASRLLHISVKAEPRSWLNWAMANNIHPHILTLIQLKGDLLESTDEQLKRGDLVGPNPRAWARVSSILHYTGTHNRGLTEPLVEGLVGKAAAADLFLTAEEMKDLPSPELILRMKEEEYVKIIPKTIPSMYGLTYSMVAYANEVETMQKAIKFLNIMQEKATDLPAGDCKSLGLELILDRALKTGLDAELMTTPEFLETCEDIKKVADVSNNRIARKKKTTANA